MITTASDEVALAVSCTLVPNVAVDCAENPIDCAAAAQGCGTVIPLIEVEIVEAEADRLTFPA